MIKAKLQKATSRGLWDAFRLVRTEWRIMQLHRRGVRKARELAGARDLKLHLGCGSNRKAGFVNIDLDPQADLTLDLREALPFEDNSCALVYSEHFLEHLEYPETALRLLIECHRVLAPGGLFSAGVPDTEWPILEYAGTRNEGYFDLAKAAWHPPWCFTELEHINYHFRQGHEHRFAYDFKTLQRVLQMAGFAEVKRRDFQTGLDSKKWERGTLYVDGTKAGSPQAPATVKA
jgi:predicted SAM-dependent methyltransferase